MQDDYRLRKNLTISYGVRHEVQNHVDGKFNIAPRLWGFVSSPKKDGSITIRGGAGIFYDWFTAQTFEQTLRVDGHAMETRTQSEASTDVPVSSALLATAFCRRVSVSRMLEICMSGSMRESGSLPLSLDRRLGLCGLARNAFPCSRL